MIGPPLLREKRHEKLLLDVVWLVLLPIGSIGAVIAGFALTGLAAAIASGDAPVVVWVVGVGALAIGFLLVVTSNESRWKDPWKILKRPCRYVNRDGFRGVI